MERGRKPLRLERERANHRLHRTGSAERMCGERLGTTNGEPRGVLPENALDARDLAGVV